MYYLRKQRKSRKSKWPFFITGYLSNWQPNLKTLEYSYIRSESHSVVSNSWRPCNSLGQNTGVGSLSLFQGIFPTQGSDPGHPHCKADSLPTELWGKPPDTHIGRTKSISEIYASWLHRNRCLAKTKLNKQKIRFPKKQSRNRNEVTVVAGKKRLLLQIAGL